MLSTCDVKVGGKRELPCLCAAAEIVVAWPEPAPAQPQVMYGATTDKTEKHRGNSKKQTDARLRDFDTPIVSPDFDHSGVIMHVSESAACPRWAQSYVQLLKRLNEM